MNQMQPSPAVINSNNNKNHRRVEVATLIREAGAKIGILAEDSLLVHINAQLEKEFIVHDWQLARLDSAQWQALGAPMGLAVAVQAMVEDNVWHSQMLSPAATAASAMQQQQQKQQQQQQQHHSHAEPQRYSSGLTSRASATIHENDQWTSNSMRHNSAMAAAASTMRQNPQTSMIQPSVVNRHAPLQVMEGTPSPQQQQQQQQQQTTGATLVERAGEDGDDSTILQVETTAASSQTNQQPQQQQQKTKEGSTCSLHKRCCGKEVPTCFRDMLKAELTVENTSCFVMSKLFDQALLHSKSGADLKAHTMFVIELSVVASALFLGAAIELWGAFPLDAVSANFSVEGGIPQALAFAFNLTSALLIISQLLCASAWIWSLRVISAVAPTKFHQYTVETRHFSDYINGLSMFGFSLFALDLFLLLAGMSLATTDNWLVNGIALGVALLVFLLGGMACHKITSFLGRVTYHGMLMIPQDPHPSVKLADNPEEYHFKLREDMLHKTFERNSILHESKALDAYSQTCNPDFCTLFSGY